MASRYHDSADENVMVIIIIEEARAVERIDEIAATPGVDVLFIGTSDFRFRSGCAATRTIPSWKSHRAGGGCRQAPRQIPGTAGRHTRRSPQRTWSRGSCCSRGPPIWA